MPILSREPDVYPETLFEEPQEFAAEDADWCALYTMSRREKQLVRLLRSQHIPHYCPTIEQIHRSPNGRLRKSYIPLFSNYVFMLGDEQDRYTAKTTNCVSREIAVHDPSQLINDLRQIHQLVLTGSQLTPESRIETGTRVRVKSGMLRGQEGCVISRRGERRLLVSVNFLQRGASVLLDDVDLETI
ncbi:MAG: transcription termination/antitermination NusG family protein [Planctomycetaceae bacterium]